MDMVTVISCIACAALVVLAVVVYLNDKRKADLKAIRTRQRQYEAELRQLESDASHLSVRQSYISDENAQINRLFEEQISLKLEAVDACKAMLREAMSSGHRN